MSKGAVAKDASTYVRVRSRICPDVHWLEVAVADLDRAPTDVDLRMTVHELDLPLKSGRVRPVIGVHPREVLAVGEPDTFVQGVGDTCVLLQRDQRHPLIALGIPPSDLGCRVR